MKNKILLAVLFVAAALGINAQHAAAQYGTNGNNVGTERVRIERSGDMVHLMMDIVLNDVRLSSAAGLDIVPVMITYGHELILPGVALKGPNEFRAYQRSVSVMGKRQRQNYQAPYIIEKGRRWNDYTIEYRYTFPYEPWMDGVDVELIYKHRGCGSTSFLYAERLGNIGRDLLEGPAVNQFIPNLAFIQPHPEAVKTREKQAEVFLDFVVNRIDIRPDFMNNPRELAKIHAILDELRYDDDISVKRMDIIGFASPEGPLANNKRLSEGRAMALRNYLFSLYDFPRDIYHIVFGGENWDGLVAALETADVPYKDEVLHIIETVPIEQNRESKLMALRGGVPYRYMLKNIFPNLRVAICKIEYDIRNFSVEEAREIIRRQPQKLSLNEMFLVANIYEEGSQEFVDVFETAVRMFPDNEVAILNAAASALRRNDFVSAERYLDRITTTAYPAEYFNTKGVLALMKEEYGDAEYYLRKAADLGLDAARQNLEELAGIRTDL